MYNIYLLFLVDLTLLMKIQSCKVRILKDFFLLPKSKIAAAVILFLSQDKLAQRLFISGH